MMALFFICLLVFLLFERRVNSSASDNKCNVSTVSPLRGLIGASSIVKATTAHQTIF